MQSVIFNAVLVIVFMDYQEASPLLMSCSHVPCSLQNRLGKFHIAYFEAHAKIY